VCACTPTLRTPFCGKPGCQWPEREKPHEKAHEKRPVTARPWRPYRPKKRWTDEDHRALLAMEAEGLPPHATATKLGVTPAAIYSKRKLRKLK